MQFILAPMTISILDRNTRHIILLYRSPNCGLSHKIPDFLIDALRDSKGTRVHSHGECCSIVPLEQTYVSRRG